MPSTRRPRWIGAGLLALAAACGGPGATSERQPSESASTDSGGPTETSAATGPDTETETETGAPLPCPPAPCDACVCVDGELDCDCPPSPPEAGFVELEGAAYELGMGPDTVALESSSARWFWAYQGAHDDEDGGAPVFVLFNGGPGVSSGLLLGFNVGETSFDPSLTGPDQQTAPSPAPWTEIGHLLWIDARQVGFSYGLLDDPSDEDARAAQMSLDNFNTYRDAADFVRALLRWLALQPALRDRPVVLVGESYGGTRAQVMLDMLLHPGAYADGSRRMRDPGLRDEIVAHHQAVGVDPGDPAAIAEQFGRQVLIQPALTGDIQQDRAGELFEQPGSVLDEFAADLGVEFLSCADKGGPCDPYDNGLSFPVSHGRSSYDLRAPATWLSETFNLVGARLNDPEAAAALLGVSLEDDPWFVARGRSQAWRAVNLDGFPTDDELGAWPGAAGVLAPWDRYFTVLNTEALFEFRSPEARALDIDPADPHYGEVFLSNLIWVDTLITDAAHDVVIYGPSIPLALAGYSDLVEAVVVEGETWRVVYGEDAGVVPPERVITAPAYEAGHAVSLDAPVELRADIQRWL